MRSIITISLVLICTLATTPAICQNFPVRVTPMLLPPFTPFLTDYTDPGAERLNVQVILNDLTVTEFRAKLRLTIEGVGITISTNPNYIPLPITLQGGVPQMIFGSDMADYFKLSNLVFQGLDPAEVARNGGRLPEGIYRFSIEVLDFNRNTVVSNKGSATAWIVLNDPPFINLPVNDQKLKPLDPQNIVFQWTPRHRGSPNAAFTTEYDVKLVEIWPAGRNPYDAINTLRPIFEATTNATLLVYGPSETPLVLGREYALQVRARDPDGRDVFKNNGYSEVVRFVYGEECPMPVSVDADDISSARARVRWQGSGLHSGYVVELREQKEGARWYPYRTQQSYHSILDLKAGATYEYHVTAECGQGVDLYQSAVTATNTFTTLSENPNAFVCADPNVVPGADGSPPLPTLYTNDFIKAGGFDIVVTQATGGNGRFTGEGLAVVPWFNSAKVKVTFKDIAVNSSYQLTAGNIESVRGSNSRFLLESEKTLAGGGGKGLEGTVGVFEADTLIALPGIILNVNVHPETGDITVDTRDGRVVVAREQGKTYAITDQIGNGYLVDQEGKVTKTTATDAAIAGAKGEREYSTDPDLQVDFKKADQTKYGLDDYQSVLTQNYQQTENGKYISWKALATGQTDQVAVFAPSNGDITKATFSLSSDSQPITPTRFQTNDQLTIDLVGKSDGTIDELLAYYPNPDTSRSPLVAGKLNLVSYDIERKSLVLVSVNGTKQMDAEALKIALNRIYGQGVVEWTGVQQEDITVNGIDETSIDDGGSGLLSNYTEDMKKILRSYTSDNTLAENTYYLFLVKNSTSKNKLGYMPRSKQAGFIFVEAHKNADIAQTIAHELGHGAFHLRHTFFENNIGQGTTENLMDYPARHRLDKWQWDKIHNPERVLGLFEDDEESAMVATFFNNGWEECYRGLKAVTAATNFENRKELPVTKLNTDCYGGALFQLTSGELLWRIPDDLGNSTYYVLYPDERQWQPFKLPPFDCTSCDIAWLVTQVQTAAVRYLTPIEDIIVVLEGKDLDGVESSKLLAGVFLVVDIVPGGKIFRPVKKLGQAGLKGTKKLLVTVGKTSKAYVGEVVDRVYKPFKWIKPDKVDEVLEVTDEVTYLAEDGVQRVGKLEVVRSGSEYGVKVISSAGNWVSVIGKNIDELTEAPSGYQFYTRNDQKFIRRVNAIDPNTPQLTVRYGKIVEATGKIITNADEIKLLLKTDANKSYFWSGRTSVGVGVMDIAEEIAGGKGGTTLEGILAKYKIVMPEFNDKIPSVVKLWEDVSALYANQVSGEVRAVLGKNLRPGNIWETIELIRLKQNPNVTKIFTVDPESKIETLLWTR